MVNTDLWAVVRETGNGPYLPPGTLAHAVIGSRMNGPNLQHLVLLRGPAGWTVQISDPDVLLTVVGGRRVDPVTGERVGETRRQEFLRRFKAHHDRFFAPVTVRNPDGSTSQVVPPDVIFLGDPADL